MKRNATLTIATITLITLASCGETKNKQDAQINTPEEIETKKENTAEIADASFSDGMTGKVFHNYQQIRMALVNSDTDEVQTAAGNLAESFSGGTGRNEIDGNGHGPEADDIEKQREFFSQFTEKVEPMFKESISEGAIYKTVLPNGI